MIRIVALVENTSTSKKFGCKHGLCLYIETPKHKILFDLGQDRLFADNARKMNIDISQIDTVIISHGHKDHGGALKHFMALNSTAKIYVRRDAFDPHYIKVLGLPFKVGLDKELMKNHQIVFTDKKVVIDDELILFSEVENIRYVMKSNRVLYAKKAGYIVPDDFSHEQNLVIISEGKHVLISGCSHAGIVNIQETAEKMLSAECGIVIGGFHLFNPPTQKYESDERIHKLANDLSARNSVYYTCHCTGVKAYNQMKVVLGERLNYLSTGKEIEIYNMVD